MDIRYSQKIAIKISELSKNECFSDMYKALINAIIARPKQEATIKKINNSIVYIRENKKSTYTYSFYTLRIAYFIERVEDIEVIHVLAVKFF